MDSDLLAHIIVRWKPIIGPDISVTLKPTLTLAGTITVTFTYSTWPIVPTVVYVPVFPSFGIGFTHIIVRWKPVVGPDISATLEPTLALTGAIAITLAYLTWSIIPTIIYVSVCPAPGDRFAHVVVGPEPVAGPHILTALEPALALTVSIAITFTYSTWSKISTVVYMPVLLYAVWSGFTYIVVGPEPIVGPYVLAAL